MFVSNCAPLIGCLYFSPSSHALQSQGNKRPMDWNNSPNKRNRIGGNINSNANQMNQKNKPIHNLNQTNANNPQQKKQWVNFNKNNNRNSNNFNNKRRNQNQNNREVKLNEKVCPSF